MTRKRPLEDPKQCYVYVWRLQGKIILIGYGTNNRGRPICKASWTVRSVPCVKMLERASKQITWQVMPCESREEARRKERELIAVHKPLYNTAPGCGGYRGMHSEAGKRRIGAAQIGKRRSAEFRSNMSKRLLGNQHLKGHVHTAEAKFKIGKANRERAFEEHLYDWFSGVTRKQTITPIKELKCSVLKQTM